METFNTDRELACRYKVDRATIWRWSRNGTLPKPIRLSSQITRWRASDIAAHEAKLAGGDGMGRVK